jgi:hypothetical protein
MKRAIRRLNITANDTGQEKSTRHEQLGELLRLYGLDLINRGGSDRDIPVRHQG